MVSSVSMIPGSKLPTISGSFTNLSWTSLLWPVDKSAAEDLVVVDLDGDSLA